MRGQEIDPFSAAVLAIGREDTVTLRKLLDEGLHPNAKIDDDDGTLLMCAAAAASGAVEPIRLLLGVGADVEAKTRREGLTALMYAAMALSDDAVRVLLEAGADAHVRNAEGRTALEMAKDRRRPRFVFQVPFSQSHFELTLPFWNVRHPVLDRLARAPRGGQASK